MNKLQGFPEEGRLKRKICKSVDHPLNFQL